MDASRELQERASSGALEAKMPSSLCSLEGGTGAGGLELLPEWPGTQWGHSRREGVGMVDSGWEP